MAGPREVTRTLRRAAYLVDAVPLTVAQLEARLRARGVALTPAVRAELVAVLASNLESAWNDGAAREADLRTAVQTQAAQIRRLTRIARGAIYRTGGNDGEKS